MDPRQSRSAATPRNSASAGPARGDARSSGAAGSSGGARPKKPDALGDLIAQVFALRGCGRVQSAGEFDAAWCEAVGEEFAKQTRPGAPRRGVLVVIAANSTLVQELTFQERRILTHLRARLPQQKIEKLKFRVGPVE